MGAQNTKPDATLVGHLTADEVISLKKLFNTFTTVVAPVGPKGDKALCSSYSDYQRHCEGYLDDWLAQRLADSLSVKGHKSEELIIPIHHYLHFVSCHLKGSVDEKVDVIWTLAQPPSSEPRNWISVQEITQYTRSIIESYLKSVEQTTHYTSWVEAEIGHQLTPDSVTDFAEYLLTDLFFKGVSHKELIQLTKPTKDTFSKEELSTCFTSSVLLQQLHASIISGCFRIDVDSHFVRLLPQCVKAQPAFLPEHFSVLDHSRLLFLNAQLPSELRTKWRFLFSSLAHGESFANLVGKIGDKGPTIFIIKDTGGRIFGFFATDSWTMGPKFFGSAQSFFFHLSPKFVVYPPTGHNNNFQYMNVQQQTLPNGIGMGGKLEYFGIYIDAEFGKGKSSPSCTTYACPQMASGEEFNIHHIEVWGVGPEPTKDENDRDSRSILDKQPDAKAMLEMVNRGTHSDGYREEPHCGE